MLVKIHVKLSSTAIGFLFLYVTSKEFQVKFVRRLATRFSVLSNSSKSSLRVASSHE